MQTITISAVGSGSATHWPAYGAMAEGFFQKLGLKVEYVPSQSAASALLQLTAKSSDMAETGSIDAVYAIDRGAPLTFLRIEAGVNPYQVYAKPNLHSLADLKGKTVMLDKIRGMARLYFERMAAPEGLESNSYNTVFAGSTSARMAALLSGSVDATILNTPFNFKARAARFSYLPAAPDTSTGIPFSLYSVRISWAETHRPLIAKFLAAYAQGVAWFYDPANREKAIAIIMEKTRSSRNDAERGYDYYSSLKEYSATGAITKASIGTLLAVMRAQGDIESDDLTRFYKPKAIGAGPGTIHP